MPAAVRLFGSGLGLPGQGAEKKAEQSWAGVIFSLLEIIG